MHYSLLKFSDTHFIASGRDSKFYMINGESMVVEKEYSLANAQISATEGYITSFFKTSRTTELAFPSGAGLLFGKINTTFNLEFEQNTEEVFLRNIRIMCALEYEPSKFIISTKAQIYMINREDKKLLKYGSNYPPQNTPFHMLKFHNYNSLDCPFIYFQGMYSFGAINTHTGQQYILVKMLRSH